MAIIKLDAVTLGFIRPILPSKSNSAVRWTQNNRNKVTELVKRGMDAETGIYTARQLNKDANQYNLKGTSLKDDVAALGKIKSKLDKATKTYNKIKRQITGRNSRNLSDSKKRLLASELEIAKDTVAYLKKEYKSKYSSVKSDSYSFGVLATAILGKFNRLKKQVPSVPKAYASKSTKSKKPVKNKRSKSRKTTSKRRSRSRR